MNPAFFVIFVEFSGFAFFDLLYFGLKGGETMLKGIKLRLYPNKTQKNQLWQMFGNDRFVWNQMLAMMNERYKNNKKLPFLSKFKLDCLLKPLKQEYPFLKKSDSSSLQVVNASLNQAWKNFFSDKTGKVGKPRFHSRKYLKYSYTGKSVVQVIGKRYLKMPKLSYVKFTKSKAQRKTIKSHIPGMIIAGVSIIGVILVNYLFSFSFGVPITEVLGFDPARSIAAGFQWANAATSSTVVANIILLVILNYIMSNNK